MNTQRRVVAAVTMLGLLAAPVCAAEMAVPEIPVKTLADFRAEYSGTKPIVAVHKYWEYEMLQAAPKPTLLEPRMRQETTSVFAGTKPVVADLKRLEGAK